MHRSNAHILQTSHKIKETAEESFFFLRAGKVSYTRQTEQTDRISYSRGQLAIEFLQGENTMH